MESKSTGRKKKSTPQQNSICLMEEKTNQKSGYYRSTFLKRHHSKIHTTRWKKKTAREKTMPKQNLDPTLGSTL
jgi:hypothetical protein